MQAADAPSKQQRKLAAKKARLEARERFKKAHIAEKKFARQLSKVAREVGKIVKSKAPKGVVPPSELPKLTAQLNRYGDLLRPWATAVSKALVAEVGLRDLTAWQHLGEEIGRSLRQEVETAPTGVAMRKIMNEQVTLIRSLPIEAAQRVHKLTIEGMVGGTRAKETAQEIMRTEHVTRSRAMLIARTETTRTATAMVEARSRYVGSEGYIWRTSRDSDVRKEHKKLEGKFIRWNDPPIAGPNGMRYHAGAGPNCRCHPEPVIPDDE